MSKLDEQAEGFTGPRLDALRYDGHLDHPLEVAGMLHALMPSGVRVLDVGCGTGSVTLIVNRNRKNTVIAIEPDPQRAEVARSRGLTVHAGYLDEDFLSTNDSFDVVMAADVLEHTPAPAGLLKLMIRALKPNGILLISVPNVAHWSVRLNLLLGHFDYEPVGIMDATHLRWFTARTITSLLESNGLQLIKINHTAGTDLPIYGRGILRKMRGKRHAIRFLSRALPTLFGVQHIIKAGLRAAEGATR